MFRIGLLSDTHGYFDPRINSHFGNCDEIWHAGDIGDSELILKLERIAPVVAVYGNIDDKLIRSRFPENQRQSRENLDIWMTHIGGYPGRYAPGIRGDIMMNPPGLFISGHSHILKVIPDKKHGLLHINPGSAGRLGMHRVRTLVRFEIHSGQIRNLDLIELGPRSGESPLIAPHTPENGP